MTPDTRAEGGALVLHVVRIALPQRVLVRGLFLDVAPGEVVTVMGASGAGKSSLLAFGAGILFQDDLLFPHLSVAGNLLFGLSEATRSRAARREAVERALEDAGLAGFGERDPATLSGGQRSRIALMRTLLARPRLLLLDEPFGKLDAALREDFRRFVFEHARSLGLPTLMVTHDAADATAAGGRVLVLE